MKFSQLTITTEGLETLVFDVEGQLVTVGRSRENDVVVSDSKVSRNHCRLELSKQQVSLEDCGSKNGTFVNDTRQEKIRLLDGDSIRVGNSVLSVSLKSDENFQDEETLIIDVVRNVVFQDEHTQESIISHNGGSDNSIHLPAVAQVEPACQKFVSLEETARFIKKNKIYLFAACLFGLGISLFMDGNNSPKDYSSPPPQAGATQSVGTKVTITKESAKKSVSDEDRQEAMQITVQADTLRDLEKYKQALALYNNALKLDPDNVRAKSNLGLLNKQLETLARKSFENGLQAYTFVDYKGALNYWQNTLYLLENHQNHELYKKTTRLLGQVRMKLSQ